MKAAAAVELRGVTKDFAVGLRGLRLRALDDVHLRIECGEIFGLLGPNGSGKSTTIKTILGLIAPTIGSCEVFGVSSTRIEARGAIGYLPESPDFYRHLTGLELVKFYARLCGLRGEPLSRRVNVVLDLVGLRASAGRRVGTYSKGMLQRVGLAQALVHDPLLLILDEPTAGVDPVGTAAIGELLLRLKAAGKTVLITSHLLEQIEDLCDRVAILDRGRIVYRGEIGALNGAAEQPRWVIESLPATELAELRAWLARRGGSLAEIEAPRVRLDQVFLERVGRAAAHRTFDP